ncbi:uncharacterized protein LOC128550971 [Mercenaria mercenaria]|uniref:uncharacterized protein LOC128550971 n=1 Tax=Mercenaria mercenaria TaxID=6596 RepID=UPI00234F6170|nr:uncharacterized protein LOC128550971 [Mercenaria mercenaria]
MADNASIQQIFQDLAIQLKNVSTAIGTQSVQHMISKFDGKSEDFKSWVKSIEKYSILNDLNDERKKLICYQTATGPVSDFIHRFINENQDCTWAALKHALFTRFSEIHDSQHALYLLQKIKQKPDENVNVYAERLLTLAEDAYENQDQGQNHIANLAVIQKQLIGHFLDGLTENFLKMKVMRDSPETLQAAVTSAMNEQNLRDRFNLPLGNVTCQQNISEICQKAKDLDHTQPQIRCQYCRRLGHNVKQCRTRQKYVHAILLRKKATRHMQKLSQSKFQNNYDWKKYIDCWNCGKLGHFMRECKSVLRPKKNIFRPLN